jgi:hypothetical protein
VIEAMANEGNELGALRLAHPVGRGPALVALTVGLLLVPLAVWLLVDPDEHLLGAECALAALALAALGVRGLRRTVDFHEHGLRRGKKTIFYRELERMRIDVVRLVGGAAIDHPEQLAHELVSATRRFSIRFEGQRRRRVQLRSGTFDRDREQALASELERATDVLAARLDERLRQHGELTFGTMARLTPEGIEARESVRLLGPETRYTIAWRELQEVRLIRTTSGLDQVTKAAEARPYLHLIGGGRNARIDCSDDNVHAVYRVLLRRVSEARRGEPLEAPTRLTD